MWFWYLQHMELGTVILGGYFLLLLIVGFISSRKEDVEGYLIANSKLGAFASTASILASKTGGGTILVGIAYVIIFGSGALLYYYLVLPGVWPRYPETLHLDRWKSC